MYARTAAFLALASTASAQGLGAAIVNNNCASPVYLWNVPSSGGGGSEVDQTIAPGATYSQTYESLTNGNGWSLKLAPTNSQANLMQFEYTYQNAGVVWFDISYVNGDPFNSDWFLSASDPTCVPKQTYYRYSTDDQNGMQPTCSPQNNIILTLCPGGAPESSSSSSAAPSSSDPSSEAAPSTTAAPSQPILAAAPVVDAIFTTFITQVVTVDVTAIEKRQPEPTAPAKRDAHAHDHQHFHRHAHAHAHL